jgi:general secretion pathway protein K
VRREAGVALLVVTVTIAVVGAGAAEFAYNARVDLEAAVNSRDMLRAEYLARSSVQLGQLLIAVQNGLYRTLPEQMRDLLVITDYANFLVQAFGGDKEAREGLGGLIGLDLASVEGLGTGKGTSLELTIQSEEGKYPINCGGGLNTGDLNARQRRIGLYRLIDALIRPPRYSRMFNVADRDGVVITYEDLPRAIIDWTDVDIQRYEPGDISSAAEDRYDRGQDRYEAHNHFMDTVEEMTLIRGVSEDFWAAFGELFTVYGTADCRVLASAIPADAWPLVAAMIAASSPDQAVVFDPNTALVAQQVAGILKTGLPLLKNLAKDLKLPACPVDAKQCTLPGELPPGQPLQQGVFPQNRPGQPPPVAGDSVEMLSSLICNQAALAQLPAFSQGLTSLLGASAPPPPAGGLRPIRMCPGRLSRYLRESGAAGQSPRRFFRLDARGIVQRGEKKTTQMHIRGVWDAQAFNSNPLCTNHPSCRRGTWVYYRID